MLFYLNIILIKECWKMDCGFYKNIKPQKLFQRFSSFEKRIIIYNWAPE